jgi:flagellar biosynthesis GTPase FlhF
MGADGFEPFPPIAPEHQQARGIRSLLGGSTEARAREPEMNAAPAAQEAPGAPEPQREPITMRGAESFAAALAEAEAAVPGEPVEEQLLAVGLGEPLVKDLIDTAASVALPLMSPQASLRDAVRLVIQLMIPMGRQLPTKNVAVALVGPGGSGKSACCRELLRKGSVSGGSKVACATITDDARTGGQLVALEPHFSTPMPVSDADVQSVLQAARQEGLLLIDTPAVSPADRRSVFSLATLLDTLSADLIMMTMPATLGAKPAAQMLRALRALGASALTITHADETDQLGVAVQAACAFGLAPEYLLTSRTGDERLIPIDPTSLVEHLLA